MLLKATLGANVARQRRALGLSTQTTAKAAGVRPNTWNDIELGRANPRLTTLIAVAYTLGVPVHKLLEP
jgi:transcriptional regulator with XRE-family HTH domain